MPIKWSDLDEEDGNVQVDDEWWDDGLDHFLPRFKKEDNNVQVDGEWWDNGLGLLLPPLDKCVQDKVQGIGSAGAAEDQPSVGIGVVGMGLS